MKKSARLCALILALSLLVVALCACGMSESLGQKVNWDELVLGDMLPAAPTNKGNVWANSRDELRVDVKDVTAKQFVEYLEACEEEGFIAEAVSKGDSYTAFNEEGYRLELNYSEYLEALTINLYAPIELETITWPASEAANQLPVPASTMGKFEYEYDTSFFVYIGETTKEDYEAYVTACSEKGFNLEYNKGEDYYYADNADGWHVSLEYVGNGLMSIKIGEAFSNDSVQETETSNKAEVPEETQVQTEAPTTTKATTSTGLRPEFKEAMDSYEECMNEYVEFMKKMQNNPNDPTLLLSYAQYMKDYADACKAFEAWGSEDMNAAEQKYYIEVQTRVNKKLLEAAG